MLEAVWLAGFTKSSDGKIDFIMPDYTLSSPLFVVFSNAIHDSSLSERTLLALDSSSFLFFCDGTLTQFAFA
jgi:hypothetical protein